MKDLSNENIVHIKKDGVEYIQFKRLLEYPEIQHCYTLRNDNLDFKIDGDIQVLETSYEKICDALKIDKKKIVKPIQTHTDNVEVVTGASEQFKEVDGLITNKENITLSTSSADCTSLLLYDPIKKVIGSIHSGWKGTLQRIGQKAVKKMIDEFGCNPEDIICCICPHIRKCHFEVEDDVKELFEKEFVNICSKNDVIEKGEIINNAQKYYIDTTLINKILLREIGLKDENMIDSGICTVCNSDELHSYRSDREKSGRNAAIITRMSI